MSKKVRPAGQLASLWLLLRLSRPSWWRVVALLLCMVTAAVLGLAPPLLVRQIIDVALPKEDTRLLLMLCSGYLVATLLMGAVKMLEQYESAWLGQHVIFDLRLRLYAHLQRMSLRFFAKTHSGEIFSRLISDVSGLQEMVATSATDRFENATMLVVTLISMLAMDWRLTAASLVLLPLFVYPTAKVGRLRRETSAAAQKQHALLCAPIAESLTISGALITKVFGAQDRELQVMKHRSRELFRLEIRRSMLAQLFMLTVQTFWTAGPAVTYYLAGTEVVAHSMSLGSLVAFVTLQSRLFLPASRLFGSQVEIQSALALFDRLLEWLRLPVEISDAPHAKAIMLKQGEVVFDRVQFEYGGGQPALIDLSFRAAPGQFTAIVGPSGAGKTTVGYLIARLFEVSGGSVRIDGQDVRDVTLQSLAAAVGLVSQETFLLHASVSENLRYARPDATDEQVQGAARAAHLHERILELPKGYDTIVGERGHTLSGGERQRLAIARVVLKDPRILILDEATSALDGASEQLVQGALEPLMKGRTTIAIAHRLSTIVRADQILVLNRGRLVEVGTHTDLCRLGGVYTDLVTASLSIPLGELAEGTIRRPRSGGGEDTRPESGAGAEQCF